MTRKFVCVALFLAAGLAAGAEPIRLAQASRVPNRTDVGVCWWACAETAGNHLNIPALQGLTAKVVETDVGWHTGARLEDISHWLTTLGVAAEVNPHGNTAEGLAWIEARLARKLPVVACGRFDSLGSPMPHAILVLALPPTIVDWSDGRGVVHHGPLISYYDSSRISDPGTAGMMGSTRAWFVANWDGNAYAFDPAAQGKPAVVQPQAVVVVPQVKPVPDIKDGVQRPDDQLRYGPFRRPEP